MVRGQGWERAYGKHWLLGGELADLGVEILSLFGGEEAVEVVLSRVHDVGYGALEGARHPS